MESFLLNYKWKKVFDINKNIIWEISGVVFDIEFEKVIWFIYKKSFLSFWVFLLENIINKLENGFVIKNKNSKKRYYEIIWKKVLNEEMQNIWFIEDIEFNFKYKLKYIIIDWWYIFPSIEIINKTKINIKKDIRKVSSSIILAYKKDCIIIKDKQSIKENKKTLENISKIFINIKNPSFNINQKNYE